MDYTECKHVGKKGPIHNKDTVMRPACWKSLEYIVYGVTGVA